MWTSATSIIIVLSIIGVPILFRCVGAAAVLNATNIDADVPLFNTSMINDLIGLLRDHRNFTGDIFQLDEHMFDSDNSSGIDDPSKRLQLDISERQCMGQINAALRALMKGELWALRMFDAWGKIPSGILSGNTYELGDYDACLTIRHDDVDSESSIGDIRGQYCLAQLYANSDDDQIRVGDFVPLLSSSSSSSSSASRQLERMPTIDTPIRMKGMDAQMLARALPGGTGANLMRNSLMVALCVPAKCTPDMVARSFAMVARMMRLPLAASVTSHMCSRAVNAVDDPADDGSHLNGLDVATIVVFSFVAATMLISTMYDLYVTFHSKDAPKSSALFAFSVYTNGHKLFQLQPNPAASNTNAPMAPQLQCLNGIRALSIIWVVFGHTYMVMAVAPLVNAAHILDWIELPRSVFLLTATVAVDTFFVMSGLLVARALLNRLDQSATTARHHQRHREEDGNNRPTSSVGCLNLPVLYAHRYVRLTPPLAAILLLSASLLRRFGDGPLWSTFLTAAEAPCRRWWWTTLLYVQNYVNPTEMCLGYTWYLSVDTQLYVLAPLLVWPLWWLMQTRCGAGRRLRPLRRLWLVVLPTLALASMAATFLLFVTNHLSGRILTNLLGGRRMELTYYPTHTRAGAWLIGVMLGFAMHEQRGRHVIIAKHVCAVGWALCIGTVIAVLAGNYPLQSSAYPDSSWIAGAYEALSRVAWSAAVAWLVFACAHGYGGPVNWLLALPGWQPLARLSYCIYLVHLPVQVVLAAQRRVPGYFNDVFAVAAFWSAFGITLMVAVVWTLAFESPVLSLERALRVAASRRRQRRGGTTTTTGSGRRPRNGDDARMASSREELVWTTQQQQQPR